MLNIKEQTFEKMLEARVKNGFCIQTGDQAFDFHFSSSKKEEDKLIYNYHHRLQFRHNFIAIMKLGEMPFAPKNTLTQAQERSKTRSEIKNLKEQN